MRAPTFTDVPADQAMTGAFSPAAGEPLRAVMAGEVGASALAWLRLAQRRYRNGVRGLFMLTQCRTPQDFVAARADLLCEDLDLIRTECEGISEIVAAAAGDAVRVIDAKGD